MTINCMFWVDRQHKKTNRINKQTEWRGSFTAGFQRGNWETDTKFPMGRLSDETMKYTIIIYYTFTRETKNANIKIVFGIN